MLAWCNPARLALAGLLALSCTGSVPAVAARYLVRPDGSSELPTIQAAIDHAARHDVIELADGTFRGPGNHDVDFRGKAITVRSVGGDPTACVIDCRPGPDGRAHRGFIFQSQEGRDSRLIGVTITLAQARGDRRPATDGGAVLLQGASPTLERCVFRGNRAESGGAVSCLEASPTIVACVFEANTATLGGALASFLGAPEITDCEFVRNTAAWGGAFLGVESSGKLERCRFAVNLAERGGAVAGRQSPLVLVDCLLAANQATLGGGVYCTESSPTLSGCTIVANTAGSGGGIHCQELSTLSITRSVVAFSVQGEAVACGAQSSLEITCCLVYGNGGGDWVGAAEPWRTRAGNLWVDPLFLDLNGWDYRLDPASPCRGAGACGRIGAPETQSADTPDVEDSE